jgi:hypothetical protein
MPSLTIHTFIPIHAACSNNHFHSLTSSEREKCHGFFWIFPEGVYRLRCIQMALNDKLYLIAYLLSPFSNLTPQFMRRLTIKSLML